MTTKQAQRRQRAKQQAPRLLSLGAWSQIGEGAPDFGPVNPPPESLAAGQTERVIKDVVRVGRYFLGYNAAGKERYWEVTPAVLSQIETNFRAMKANGQRPNLVKTHGDLSTLMVHPDDLMAPIDDVKIVGDTLWMSAYVGPEEAKYLQNPARKVSIGSLENYSDSEDRRYPGDSLLHVAVTDRPAVNGQGSFVAMADGASQGGGSMNPEIVKAFNELFGLLGQGPMADVADEEQLLLLVNDRIKSLGGSAAETPAETDPPADTEGGELMAEDSLDMTGVPAAMQSQFRRQHEQIKALQQQVQTAEADKAKTIRDNFMAQCDQAMRVPVNGKVASKADVDRAKALADRLKSFDAEIISLIPRTLNVGGAARTLASPNPTQGGSDPDADRKARAESLAKRRGISVDQAMKFITPSA